MEAGTSKSLCDVGSQHPSRERSTSPHAELVASFDLIRRQHHEALALLLRRLVQTDMLKVVGTLPSSLGTLASERANAMSLLATLCQSADEHEVVSKLRQAEQLGSSIHSTALVDFIIQVLDGESWEDSTPSEHVDSRCQVLALLIKAVQESGLPPSSLLINNVQPLSENIRDGGSFADILRGTYKGRFVALKQVRIARRDTPAQRKGKNDRFIRESLLWRYIRHPFLLSCYGVDADYFHSMRTLRLISPWMDNGNIKDYLDSHASVSTAEIEIWISEIAMGLSYLHLRNVVHGDLRAVNILLDEARHVRLADFGLGVYEDTNLESSQHHGNWRWWPPELIKADMEDLHFRRERPMDIYALACVCMELYTLLPPFYTLARRDGAVSQVVLAGKRPTRPSLQECHNRHLSDRVWELVVQCWSHNPSDRPGAQAVAAITTAMVACPSYVQCTIKAHKHMLWYLQRRLPHQDASDTLHEVWMGVHRSNDIEIIRNYSVTQKLFQAMSLKASCATEDVRQNLKADVLDDLDVLEKVLSSDVLRATALCQSPGDALTFTHSVKALLDFDQHICARQTALRGSAMRLVDCLTNRTRANPDERQAVESDIYPDPTFEHSSNVNAMYMPPAEELPDPEGKAALVWRAPLLPNNTQRGIGRFTDREHAQSPPGIKIDDIELDSGEPIAVGEFSDIFKARHKEQAVAVKRLRVPQRAKQARLYHEARVLQNIKHPQLVPILAVLRDEFGFVNIISPWMTNGTLSEYARHYNPSQGASLKLVREVCSGLLYLHEINFVHGDIKAANVLIDEGRRACLTDFGLENVLQLTGETSVPASLRWSAPEKLFPDSEDAIETLASDVYSFGVLCWEVYSRQTPFAEIRSDLRVLKKVLQGDRPSRTASQEGQGRAIPDNLWDVIQHCWSAEPSKRPTVKAILKALKDLSISDDASRFVELSD